MYKLQPAYKDYVWGGNKLKKMYDMKNGDRLAESWALSVHPDGSSMYLASFADYIRCSRCKNLVRIQIENGTVTVTVIEEQHEVSEHEIRHRPA